MSGLVYGCIAPHGLSIISELAGDDLKSFKPTRDAMEMLGERMKAHRPDTIVILTPHGLRLQGYNAVYISEYCRGSLGGNGKTVNAEFHCDKPMAQQILTQIEKAHIPVVGANYGSLSGKGSNIAMDWGTFIPLWFFGAQEEPKPDIVVIGPTRDIPLEQLVTIGEIIARVAEQSGKRVALVASADQAHAHDAEGPYGFDPAAKEYDKEFASIVQENRLHDLLKIDKDLITKAKPDSLWQVLILHGAQKVTPMKNEVLSYQVPTYFGMLVASCEVI